MTALLCGELSSIGSNKSISVANQTTDYWTSPIIRLLTLIGDGVSGISEAIVARNKMSRVASFQDDEGFQDINGSQEVSVRFAEGLLRDFNSALTHRTSQLVQEKATS